MIFKRSSSRINQTGEHSIRRNIQLFFSIGTAVLAKFISIGSTLITMPLTLNYLGAEGFGVWMVISGIVGFISFSDLGIGMGLQNALSKAVGEDDHKSIRLLITNGYILVAAISLSLFILFFAAFIFSLPSIELLFRLNNPNESNESTMAFSCAILVFLVGMPIGLIQRVLCGIQKTYIANNINLAGSILSLTSIIIVVHLDLGLVFLVTLFMASPIAAMLFYTFYFFYKNEDIRPCIASPSKKHIKPITSAGLWTVFTRIIYSVKMNAPTILISTGLGLISVAEFSVAQKLTGLAATLISIALQPLWVVYGEAYYRGDRDWVINSLKKSLIIVLTLSCIAAVCFQFSGLYLIELWLGNEVLPSKLLITAFSLWMISLNINVCFAMFLNGTGHFKRQSIFSFICVGLMLILIKLNVETIGVEGVVFVMFAVSELLCIPLYLIETIRVIRKTPNANQ